MASQIELHQEVMRRTRRPTAAFLTLSHTLRVTDIRLAFMEACREAHVDMDFRAEVSCFHAYEFRRDSESGWTKAAFRPDGYIGLRLCGCHEGYLHCFVEADMGTVSKSKWQHKVSYGYPSYLETGLFGRRYGGESFRVLVVASSPTRMKHLRALSADSPGCDAFLFTSFDALTEHGPFTPIWLATGHSQPVALGVAV
jgi:hypothetical protein